jgi:RNase P protein component
LIREVFRRIHGPTPSSRVDVVVIPRGELLSAPYASLQEDFRGTLRRGLARLDHARR